MRGDSHEMKPFGQGTEDRCAVACARYLLHCWQIPCLENNNWTSQNPTEELLCRLLASYKSQTIPGYSYVAVAQMFLNDFHQKVHILCGENVECINDTIEPLIERGTPKKLKDWLLSIVSHPDSEPVMVAVDPEILDNAPRANNRHSVVVLCVEDRQSVYYLEPDSVRQSNYPKEGVIENRPIERFIEAWEEHGCLALMLDKENAPGAHNG